MNSSILSVAIRTAKGATLISLTTSLCEEKNSIFKWTSCESSYNNPLFKQNKDDNRKFKSNLKTRMTSIGRFSHDSETLHNPSVPTLFLAMSGTKPFRASDFIQLWKDKKISENHPRFKLRIDEKNPGYFTSTQKKLEECITDSLFPASYRKDLAYRIVDYLMKPLKVHEHLWEAQVCSGGELGKSGAISQFKTGQILQDSSVTTENKIYESLVLFRSHHAMADGTSLASSLIELCDEAESLKSTIKFELKKRSRKARTLLQKLKLWIGRLFWFYRGIFQSLFYQMMLVLKMPQNPFDVVLSLYLSSGADVGTDLTDNSSNRRTISWCDAAPVAEVKAVAQAFGQKVTINDVWVSCASYAISKQLEQHRGVLEMRGKSLPTYPDINVVIPVHLTGGVLLPHQSMGNMIGAFGARIPGEGANDRLTKIHSTLSWIKRSPSALISYAAVRFTNCALPTSWTKYLFSKANGNACATISNVRGSPKHLHIGGNQQTIQSMAGFMPLPPGIPIGVVITSYAGTLTLTVTAQPWAIPDADQFLLWMLEEYKRLLVKSGVHG